MMWRRAVWFVASFRSMLGIELFDVASNFSTWHRTFRCGVEMFEVGHRNVAGEGPLTSSRVVPRHSRIAAYVMGSRPRCAAILLDPRHKTLSGLASRFRWGRRISGYSCTNCDAGGGGGGGHLGEGERGELGGGGSGGCQKVGQREHGGSPQDTM